jgi:UDP-3-O-[3-hydroxymyristoyl] glucosamine N-acyltransferase
MFSFVTLMNKPNISDIIQLIRGIAENYSDFQIKGVAGIEEAKPQDLSFISNPKYVGKLSQTKAGAVLIKNDLQIANPPANTLLIRCADPYLSFCIVLERYFNPILYKQGIEASSFIATENTIPNSVYIGAQSYISRGVLIEEKAQIYPQVYLGENVRVGGGSIIYPGVKVYANSVIGKNCIIHSGTVIGSDGFGHAPMPAGSYAKIPQVGNVVIGNNVEIGANCTIDRATLGSTVIEDGVKLDNLIQVAHNVRIGAHTVIASQTGISGSTVLGKHCMVGGQVGFAGHIQIADGSRFGAQSGVPASIKEKGKDWMGTPILPLKENLKAMVIGRNLPKLEQRIRELETKIKELTNNNES